MLFQLADIRKRAGMTQKETASRLGVGQSAVSMWESGDAVPRAELLPKIADVLGCTIDELYGRGPRDVVGVPKTSEANFGVPIEGAVPYEGTGAVMAEG